jgi:transcription antitermination factor NusG
MSQQLQPLDKGTDSDLPDSGTDADTCAPCGSNPADSGVIKLVAGHGGARRGAGRKPAVAFQQPDEPRWYCVRTQWGQDIRADIAIRQSGFQVFAPTLWKPPSPARRSLNGAMRPAREARIIPLFSRYLFARFNLAEPGWQAIRGLPGVEAILSSTPESPTPVPEPALEAVRSLCAPNGCVYPPGWEFGRVAPVQRPLEAGCHLRVLYGPLADHVGICQMSDGRRVELLLEILGRTVRTRINQCDVEVA